VIDLIVDDDDDVDVDAQKMNKILDFVEQLLTDFVEVLFVILLVFVQLLLQFHH
jgi:hypothetical protein